jgi:hypothetical protein
MAMEESDPAARLPSHQLLADFDRFAVGSFQVKGVKSGTVLYHSR